ncbi:hypothetical protein [Pseudodesulfovibrio sp.]|uniref:hypothetical protein n=1 Tax=unclassified Pseudodesulfovibrio TaxID=2661612 RepID=UPI003B00F523
MATILPQSELTRKAVAWVCEKREEGDTRPLPVLLEDAGVRFNLSPKDVEFLMRFFKDKQD